MFDYDDGSGPALYAGGRFLTAGGEGAGHVARWDGTGWSSLASGLAGTTSDVRAFAAFDDGGGRALYAGGLFWSIGGVETQGVARWDGSAWSAVGSGLGGTVQTLAVFDSGIGQGLYAGGSNISLDGEFVPSRMVRWDGTSWAAVGGAVTGSFVGALLAYDDGSGPTLFAGGNLFADGGNNVAKFVGPGWDALGGGTDGEVWSLVVYDDGTGDALYAGGDFSSAGAVSAENVARWDGTSWSALGAGVGGSPFAQVDELFVYDDGSGPALWAGGDFTMAGGQPAQNIARWDGTGWAALGTGTSDRVWGLAAHDDGGGGSLFVGGAFLDAGGTGDSFLARWGGCASPAFPSFCDASDGALAACPCANPGATDTGCDNAQGTGGVRLEVVARSTVPNGATLRGTGFPTTGAPTAVVIRSSALEPSGAVAFGDGARCVATSPLVRLAATPAVGGASTHVFGHGAMAGPGFFHYQAWYRSTPSTFCDAAAAFNLSSGVTISWP